MHKISDGHTFFSILVFLATTVLIIDSGRPSSLPSAETSEDISPYATFQLSEASTLAQTHHLAPTNTLLHSFMYHERAMTEGCASPPTAAAVRRNQNNKSPYYNVVGYLSPTPINWLGFSFCSEFAPLSCHLLQARFLTISRHVNGLWTNFLPLRRLLRSLSFRFITRNDANLGRQQIAKSQTLTRTKSRLVERSLPIIMNQS